MIGKGVCVGGNQEKWEEGQGFTVNVHWQRRVSRLCVFLAVKMQSLKWSFSERTDRQVAWTEVMRPEATIKLMTFLPALDDYFLRTEKQKLMTNTRLNSSLKNKNLGYKLLPTYLTGLSWWLSFIEHFKQSLAQNRDVFTEQSPRSCHIVFAGSWVPQIAHIPGVEKMLDKM